MAMLWKYHCKHCRHEWTLLSKRYEIGPTAWGAVRYNCFSCLTFLTIAKQLDRKNWQEWLTAHVQELRENQILLAIANSIEAQLAGQKPYSPVQVMLGQLQCPTCLDPLSTLELDQQEMRCPNCTAYAGFNPEPHIIDTF